MTKSPSRRDLETLSAYLDGQLSQGQTRKLEAQLKGAPDLQRALEDLRQTRRVLRSASQVRAPRNFTLTPEMAGRRVSAPRGYTAMRLVAVTASLMFAFVFAGDLLLGSSFMRGGAFAPAAEPVMESYSMQDDAADEAKVEALEEAEAPLAPEVPELEAAPPPAQERAVEAETDSVEGALTESENTDAAAPKAAVEEPAGGGALDVLGTPTVMGTPVPPGEIQVPPDTPEGTPPPVVGPIGEVESTEEVEATGEVEPADDVTEPSDGATLPNEVGFVGEDQIEKAVDIPEDEVESRVQIPFIRIVEGGLIAVALLTGGLAIFLRRRMK